MKAPSYLLYRPAPAVRAVQQEIHTDALMKAAHGLGATRSLKRVFMPGNVE
jgi:hypothetical protein